MISQEWFEMSMEADVDQSYAVMEWLTISMAKVTANPEMYGQFLYQMTTKMEDIIDSVMTLTPEEHRGPIAELLTALTKMNVSVLQWKAVR